MANNLNRQKKTVFHPKSIAAAGKRAGELNPGELGLFDCETERTVSAAEWCADKMYQFKMGSYSLGQKNTMFPDPRGAKLPLTSLEISRVDKAHLFDGADAEGKPFVSYLGWDGISNCKTLSFDCGQAYGLLVKVKGQTIRNTFGGNNLEEIIPFSTGCCEDCAIDEKCDTTMDTILKAIEKNAFYVNKFFKFNKVKSCCPAEAPFAKIGYTKFKLTVCDTGDFHALAAVQNAYPTLDIEFVERNGADSTYMVCVPDAVLPDLAVAANVTATIGSKHLVDTTAARTITVPASVSVASVLRVVDVTGTAATNNITLAGAYVGVLNTNYVDVVLRGNGVGGWVVSTLAVQPADFTMTKTKVLVCDDCPDCPNTFTKVDAGDSYVVCFTEAAVTAAGSPLANFTSDDPAVVKAAVDLLAATVPGYVVNSASKLGFDCGKVTVQLCVTAGQSLTAFNGGTTTKIGECAGYCTGSATFSWCPSGTAYKITRTMCMVKKNDECDAPELTDVIASVQGRTDIVAGSVVIKSTNDCMTEYTLEQVNNACLEDGCDTYGKDGAKFDAVSTFQGQVWTACGCEGWTFDVDGCPVAPVTSTVDDCLCGIKFEALAPGKELIPCNYGPDDQIEREPTTLEISIIDQSEKENCALLEVPYTVVQWPTVPKGDGRFVMRDEITSRNYDGYIYTNPKSPQGGLYGARLGYNYATDPSKFYNAISLYHNYDRNRQGGHKSDSSQREMITFYVEQDNVLLFEALKKMFNATLLSHGVCKLLG
jgi:hypothetical protein